MYFSMDTLQQVQDDEYFFPYHYVSQFRPGFTQCYYDSWGINYSATIEFLIEKLREEDFASVVDVGCGDGRLVYELNKVFASKEILGIDYSKRAIALAKAMNPYGDYRQLDILNQSGGNKYDLAMMVEVFEHIKPDESEKFVEAVSNLLVPNGLLFVTVPHINKPVEYKHYRHFSSQSLTKCFESQFEVMEIIAFEKGKRRKKIIDFILSNRLFILNNHKLKNFLYEYYKRNLFYSKEENCNRLFMKFKLK